MRLHRLQSKGDFRGIFRYGRYFESALFRICVRSNALSYDRFAFVVPKTVDKRAVIRNKLRRRTREWIIKHSSSPHHAFDVIILFKRESAVAYKTYFYEDLSRIIKKSIG